MAGLLDGLFTVLIFVTVFLTALAIGLMTNREALRRAVGRRTFGIAVLVNVVVVPALGYLIVRAFDLDSGAETGILLCAVCAAGPIALKVSQIARNDLTWALSLTAITLSLNVIGLPIWSGVLLHRSLTVQPADLLAVLLVAVVLPVVLGVRLGTRSPTKGRRSSSLATSISNVTLVLAVGVGIFADADDLIASLSSRVLVVAAIIVTASGLIGWAVPDATPRRRATSLATLNRATSVALLVGARAFPGDTEVFTAVVVFGLVQTVAGLALSCYWRWISLTPAPAVGPAAGFTP